MANIIKKIYIKNFRSIVEETIECESMNIFVGKNDVGKSNVLKALDLFFNYENKKFNFKDNFSLYHKTAPKKAKEITIELSITIPESFSEHGDIIWTKVWREDGLVTNEWNKKFKAYSRAKSFLSKISYEYIPAVKSEQYFQNLLVKLYNALLNSVDSKIQKANDAYSAVLQTITTNLSTDIKSSLNLDSYLQMPTNMDELFKDLLFQTKHSNGEVPLKFRGDGIQARHIPVILKFIANKLVNDIPKRSVHGAIIWGFEEPENGVELSACYELAQQLNNYSSEIQMFLTTHSPAIYSLKKEEKTNLYNVTLENNTSKYCKEDNIKKIDTEMGIMSIIEPYISQEVERLKFEKSKNKELIEKINKLQTELNKILIFTEGKTDIEYLKIAFDTFRNYQQIKDRIIYYNINNSNETGDAELFSIFKYLQKGNDSNIKICIFDRDVLKYIIPNEYEEGENNVFRFNIPTPSHRNTADLISIEHYLTDDDLHTIDNAGRKVFLAKDFNSKGITSDRQFIWKHAKTPESKDYNPLEIISGSGNKKVFKVDEEIETNYALSKIDLIEHIKNKDAGFEFDLSQFEKILTVIKKIVDCVDSKNPS